jgi:hypothetical protein
LLARTDDQRMHAGVATSDGRRKQRRGRTVEIVGRQNGGRQATLAALISSIDNTKTIWCSRTSLEINLLYMYSISALGILCLYIL